MSGGGGGVIILKIVRDALSVGIAAKGRVKLWHVLVTSHVLNGIGWFF